MAEVLSFFAHGSRWVRADFHLHTRLGREFKDNGANRLSGEVVQRQVHSWVRSLYFEGGIQTIFEHVIKLIRSLKKNVQFIFATHNANFPVLGDAEQVGACAFAGGNADIQVGSIDKPGIQKTIFSIMEGGHEAFARRKDIYLLWKQ